MTTGARWSVFGSIAIIIVIAGFALPAMKRSNCGGNSAALAACKGYLAVLQLWSAEHDGRSFRYSEADSTVTHDLAQLPGASWIGSARLLARVEDVRVGPTMAKDIIMVCDQAYDNVPQNLFRKAPMTHAVAYSTGMTGLITPDEFGRLDLSGFVDLRTLAKTNKVLPSVSDPGSH